MTETLNVIGDLSTARRAAELYSEWCAIMERGDWKLGRPCFPGWRFLGAGCSRNAWLAPDGVVYKIGRNSDNYNEAMAYAINGMIEHPHFAIPKVTLFTIPGGPNEPDLLISAMEYIDGESCDKFEQEYCTCFDYCECNWDAENDCYYDEDQDCTCTCECDFDSELYDEACTFFGNTDLHSGNVKYGKNGKIYCIDLGFWS